MQAILSVPMPDSVVVQIRAFKQTDGRPASSLCLKYYFKIVHVKHACPQKQELQQRR